MKKFDWVKDAETYLADNRFWDNAQCKTFVQENIWI